VLVDFLRANTDIFAWSPSDMPSRGRVGPKATRAMALGVGRKSLIPPICPLHNPTNIWSSPAQIFSWPSNHSASSVCLVSGPENSPASRRLPREPRVTTLLVPRASRVAVPAGGGLTGQRAVISRSPIPIPLPRSGDPRPAIPNGAAAKPQGTGERRDGDLARQAASAQ
jgi:hypothetical protein